MSASSEFKFGNSVIFGFKRGNNVGFEIKLRIVVKLELV